MTEREFRQNGENQSGRDGRKSYNNREVENLITTEKVTIETIVTRVVTTDAVQIMALMVENSARTVLRSTLDLIIIMEATVSSVEATVIIIMVVSSVLTVTVLMEIMKVGNVLTARHVLITTAEGNASNVSSVLVRDSSRVDIASKVADTEIIVRVVSVSVQPTIIQSACKI